MVHNAMLFSFVLNWRRRIGKEHPARWPERKGIASLPRPEGRLLWIHSASVGEAQTALILLPFLAEMRKSSPFTLLMTSGTQTSAKLLAGRLPEWAIHQFYPLDKPSWVKTFLDHWRPNAAFWMESEIWPVMLSHIAARNIPLALVNGRLSPRSYTRWQFLPGLARNTLKAFKLLLVQSPVDEAHYKTFTNAPVIATGNLKYGAAPLPYNEDDLAALKAAIGNRPTWVFASTHNGEETLAAEIHAHLVQTTPGLLTIIAPRHPERRAEIARQLEPTGIATIFRGEGKDLPHPDTGLYIADTMGELGLFYHLTPIAVIGRSFSLDGGGGHNPLEAAKHDCAVLSGPNMQNLQDIFDDMAAADAVVIAPTPQALQNQLQAYLQQPATLADAKTRSAVYVDAKDKILPAVIGHLTEFLRQAGWSA